MLNIRKSTPTSALKNSLLNIQYSERIGGVTGRGGNVDASTPVGPQTWLRSPRNFAKTRFRRSPSIQFSAKNIFFGEIFRSRKSFYAFVGQFWALDRQTDLTINFLAIFRSRCTYYELCTTKNRQNFVRLRPRVFNAVADPPCFWPPLCLTVKVMVPPQRHLTFKTSNGRKTLRKYFRNGPCGQKKRFENIFVMVRAGRKHASKMFV